MAVANVIDCDQVKQAADLLEEIACSAAAIKRLFYCAGFAEPDNVEVLNCTIETARTLVDRIGWLGDLGCKKLAGRESVQGDAEQWMVHPTYADAILRKKLDGSDSATVKKDGSQQIAEVAHV